MKVAIMESVVTPGGHEIDYDRILVEETKALGHQPEFYVPEGHEFKWDYGVPVHRLPGEGVSYLGKRGIAKAMLTVKREINRQRWYRALHGYAGQGRFDMLIFPSATYRYLRALHASPLLRSPVPTVFIIHGMTPAEAEDLFAQANKVKDYPNIKIAVQTFAKEALKTDLPNIHYFFPPAYIPRDVAAGPAQAAPEVLKLGLFGQYRKEKNIDPFLEAFCAASFTRTVKLIVQGATTNEADAADFKRVIAKYRNETIEFWHKPLIGREWQAAIAAVDVVVMPYGAERYRYHTSAMLSTAVGFYKPVLAAASLNPEVLQSYDIGKALTLSDIADTRAVVEQFVNRFDDKFRHYQEELGRANTDFAPGRLVAGIMDLGRSGVRA
jgi:hypothetical protein